MGVKFSPVVGEPREVFLRDAVLAFFLGRVETIQDNSDEQVQEHERDKKREAGGGNEGYTAGKEEEGDGVCQKRESDSKNVKKAVETTRMHRI